SPRPPSCPGAPTRDDEGPCCPRRRCTCPAACGRVRALREPECLWLYICRSLVSGNSPGNAKHHPAPPPQFTPRHSTYRPVTGVHHPLLPRTKSECHSVHQLSSS